MYKINDIINVTITSILSYGVFVKADNDYTGLIHISEINEEKKQLNLTLKNIAKNTKKTNQNQLKENGLGFKELHDSLPKWIDETKKEIENSK